MFIDVSDIPLSTFGKTEKTQTLSPIKNLHLQDDQKILAVCATGTSSHDSLLSWIRLLQDSNPKLKTIAVIFTLRGTSTELQNIDQKDSDNRLNDENSVNMSEVNK
jgi:signaling intermediate in Toll pathway protein